MNSIVGNSKSKSMVEKSAQVIFTVCAFFAVLAVVSITAYMILSGTPALSQVGIAELLFGTVWKPTAAEPSYGILYVILTSIVGTTMAIILGVPIGVFTAIFLAETASKRLAAIVRPAIELLAGIPSVIYGNPEIAWTGKTEEMLAGTDYKVSIFPVAALGKAFADDETDGLVKVLSVNNKIEGAHIVCPEASSLIHQFVLMIDNGLKTDDILKTVFAHPTYSEAVFEAILGLDGKSLSLPPAKL